LNSSGSKVFQVKVDEADKQKLERLQALITLKGKKLTQQELLSVLISEAEEKSDDLVDRVLKEKTVPMSDQDFQKLLKLSDDWGIRSKLGRYRPDSLRERKRSNKIGSHA
jgi:hypothetical protein